MVSLQTTHVLHWAHCQSDEQGPSFPISIQLAWTVKVWKQKD